MVTTKYRVLSVILLWPLTLTAGAKESPSEGSIPGIIYKDGLLRVSVKNKSFKKENKSFKKVMDEITLKTGVKALINSPLDNEISVSFDYLPLEEGLQKLLSGKRCVFFKNDEEVRIKFYEALDKIPTSKGLEEAKTQAEMLNQSEEFKKIKERIPDLENRIKQQKASP
jgi:hypothetical protein